MPVIITNLRGLDKRLAAKAPGLERCDEALAIVRSYKTPVPGVGHEPLLSPEFALFRTYLGLRDEGRWGTETFRDIYVPQFLADLARNKRAQARLNAIFRDSRDGKTIVLACFCNDEALCHRSIVAGLLQGAGADVRTETGTDYGAYFAQYKDVTRLVGSR